VLAKRGARHHVGARRRTATDTAAGVAFLAAARARRFWHSHAFLAGCAACCAIVIELLRGLLEAGARARMVDAPLTLGTRARAG
jgi:hypothetical protein